MRRKILWKRRKCWLPAFSPFPTMLLKCLFFRVVKIRDCAVKELNLIFSQVKILKAVSFYVSDEYVSILDINVFCKIFIYTFHLHKKCGKRRKCWIPAFSPFSTLFSKFFFFGVLKTWDNVIVW